MTITTRKTRLRKLINKLEIGNILLSVGTIGLMVLGVFELSFPVLVVGAIIFIILALIGKYIDEVEDDAEKLEKFNEHIKSIYTGSANQNPVSCCTVTRDDDFLQPPTTKAKASSVGKSRKRKRATKERFSQVE